MRIDHVVWAAPDLESACAIFADQTGVRPAYGGKHGHGLSHNALAGLGEGCYLEIFCPTMPNPSGDDWAERAARLPCPSLFGYCLDAGDQLDALAARAQELGIAGDKPQQYSRTRPDGEILSWRLFEPAPGPLGEVPPIFINWGRSQHPSSGAPAGISLTKLTVRDPAATLLALLIGCEVPGLAIEMAERPSLRLELMSPEGAVTLHS